MTRLNFNKMLMSIYGSAKGWQKKASSDLNISYTYLNKITKGNAIISDSTSQKVLDLWNAKNPIK